MFRRQLWRLGQGPVAGARRERYGAVRFVSDDGAVAYGPGGTPARVAPDDDVAHVRLAVDEYEDGWADEHDDEYGYGYDDDAYVGGARDRDLGYGAGRPRTVFPAAVGAVGAPGAAAGAVGLALEPDWSSAGPQEPAGSAARRWAERFPQPVSEPSRSPAAARSRARAYRRRRQVMVVLVIAVAVTLAWALVLDTTALWVAHGVADALLAGYVGLLIRLRRRTTERADKVRYLAPIEAPRPAVVVLHG